MTDLSFTLPKTSAHASQAEQDADLMDMAAYLSCTRFTVNRCRHDSCAHTALWIMDGQKQIASVSYVNNRWIAQGMIGGPPVWNRACDSLLDAAATILKNQPGA